MAAQLACQQPDESVVFRALGEPPPTRVLTWRNKPQEADACIATLAAEAAEGEFNGKVAISANYIVACTGTSILVYDARTYELLGKPGGEISGYKAKNAAFESLGMQMVAPDHWNVGSVALFDTGGAEASFIVGGYNGGTIHVWDAGAAARRGRRTCPCAHHAGVCPHVACVRSLCCALGRYVRAHRDQSGCAPSQERSRP